MTWRLLIAAMVSAGVGVASAQTPQVATPVFSPDEGTYTSAQQVMITDATQGTTIYYTTNGSTPTVAPRMTSITSLPRLRTALLGSTEYPISIVCFGSSVGVGATLPDANNQSPCAVLKNQLQHILDPNNIYRWQADNQSVNGSIVWQFPASYIAMGQALAGATLAAGGTGYCVGDWETVNQGTNPGGSVLVTGTDGSSGNGCGAITRVVLSSYLNNITDADAGAPSTGGYMVASNIPLLNGATSVLSISEQSGVGTGAAVNITSVGITPTVCAFFYGMNDFQPPQFNTGETLPGFQQALGNAIQQCSQAKADVIVSTTPHYSVADFASSILGGGLPVGDPQVYPTFIPSPVSADQMQPPYPGTTGNQSVVSGDFLNNGGVDLSLDYRFLTGNQSMRDLCVQPGCVLLDAESYWLQGLQAYTTSLGSQSAAEHFLFDPGQIIHPNLYGHQASYDAAINNFGTSIYIGPITVAATETIRAIGVASGYANSAVMSATYTITPPAAAPVFSVSSGTYTSVQTVTISDATHGASIYYTTDGTAPTTASSTYSGPITVSVTTTLQAVAIATGYSKSVVTAARYTINLIAPTISWATPTPIIYGTTLGAAQLDATTTVSGSFVYTPAAGTVLAAGTQTLNTIFTPTDTAHYTTATGSVGLTVGQATPVLTLTSSVNPAYKSNEVTFTARLASAAGTPTGSVTFYDGATNIGSGTLAAGVVTSSGAGLTPGTHVITAAYSGDTDFVTVTSSALTETIADFSLAAVNGGTTPVVVAPGGQAVFHLTISALGSSTLAESVVMSVSGLPTGATATFSSATIPANSGATDATLAVNVPSLSAGESMKRPLGSRALPLALGLIILPFAGIIRGAGGRWSRMVCVMLGLGVVAVGASGCGGTAASLAPAQEYTLTITASAGSLSHSVAVNLIVE